MTKSENEALKMQLSFDELHSGVIAMGQVFRNMIQGLKELWKKIKEAISEIANIQDEIEKKKTLRLTWTIIRDTRRASQVIDNKPRHLVKKIIG